MTAPPRRRRGRGTPAPASSTTARSFAQSTEDSAEFDFDQRVVYQVDASIWRAVYRGEFRLAVRCKRCQRWLTDGRSKRAHLGPRCAAKAVK